MGLCRMFNNDAKMRKGGDGATWDIRLSVAQNERFSNSTSSEANTVYGKTRFLANFWRKPLGTRQEAKRLHSFCKRYLVKNFFLSLLWNTRKTE